MDADEREIFQFLKSWGNNFVAAREICRRAGGRRRFNEEPDWAKPVLLRMAERGVLEVSATGHYRIKPASKKDKAHLSVSPEIAELLKESGVEIEETGDIAPDDDPDRL